MEVIIIVNATLNNAIGYKNDLIYKISEDLRRFKQLTTGNCIIMGSNTFNSIGKTPLPNRLNIVITRNKEQYDISEYKNILFADNVENAIDIARNNNISIAYLIGGTNVFREGLDKNLVDKIYLTRVYDNNPIADTYFPDISSDFIIESQTDIVDFPLMNTSYNFINYKRKC
jgi:dihydrofolate reductase